jgi:hypothetical protein
MDLREIWCEGMECTYLTTDRDQWRVLVNTIVNLGIL